MRDKKKAGRREHSCDQGMPRTTLKVKPPTKYELSWKVKVIMFIAEK